MADPEKDDQIVEIDDIGPVAFPANMPDNQILMISKRLHLEAMNAKSLTEPSTYAEGFNLSLKETGQRLMKGATFQEATVVTAGDIIRDPKRALLNAFSPENMGGMLTGAAAIAVGAKANATVPNAMVRGGKAIQQAGEGQAAVGMGTVPSQILNAVKRPILRVIGNLLEKGGRATGGNVPFNQRPLAEQMSQLPTTGPTPQGGQPRQGGAPFPTPAAVPAPQMIAKIMEKATQKGGMPITPWESQFVSSIEAQITGGRQLTVAQSDVLTKIFSRLK